MNKYKKYFSFIIILCVLSSSIFSTDFNTIDDFLNEFEFKSDDIESMRRLKDESQAQSLYNSAYTGIGYAKPLKDFLGILYTTEVYAPQIDYIRRTVPGTTINRGILTASTKARVLTGYREFHDFSETKLTKNVTKMFEYASYFQIAYLTYEAYNGNDKAKLEVLKAAYSLRHGQMMSAIGINPVFGVLIAVIDLALTWAIQSTFDTYNELYYNAYSDYLETKYGDIQGWVNLAVSGNRAAIDARLNEFWGMAEYHVNNYVIDHPEYRSIWGRAGSAIAVGESDKYKKKYFGDRIARPLSNRMIQIAKQQRLNHRREVEILLFDLKKDIEEIKWLQEQLENITILDPDEVEYTAADIQEIYISPKEKTINIEQNQSVEYKVIAILKGEEEQLIDVTGLSTISPEVYSVINQLGKHTITAEYLDIPATATLTVVTEPKLLIEPSYKEIDVNKPPSERSVSFTASFSDEFGVITNVTTEVFSRYGKNTFPFDNVGEYPFYLSYQYLGKTYYAEAIINVVGCNHPEKIQNNNGDCVCDESRGYFATNDLDECSTYETVKFEPDQIETFVGDNVLLDVIGIDKNGKVTKIENISFDVKFPGANKYPHYVENRSITATIIGIECDATTEYWNAEERRCDCKEDEYTRNDEGICVPIKEEPEYETVLVEPSNVIYGLVGEEVTANIVGIDQDGKRHPLESVQHTITGLGSKNIIYTLSDGSYQMITFIGVSCDATTEYWNAEERRCDCKEDEYTRNDEGICVPIKEEPEYETVLVEPSNVIYGLVGEEVTANIVGIDQDGKRHPLESVQHTITGLGSKNIIYTLSDGSYQMITFIGVSCDATTEYWNAEERRCDCKEDEYTRNDEGICVPIKEEPEYETVLVEPSNVIYGLVGEEVTANIVGIDQDGKRHPLESVQHTITGLGSKNIIYTLSDGSYQMITFIGVSCDATTEYWNAEERRCDCKEDEYTRNDEGICVPIKEEPEYETVLVEPSNVIYGLVGEEVTANIVGIDQDGKRHPLESVQHTITGLWSKNILYPLPDGSQKLVTFIGVSCDAITEYWNAEERRCDCKEDEYTRNDEGICVPIKEEPEYETVLVEPSNVIYGLVGEEVTANIVGIDQDGKRHPLESVQHTITGLGSKNIIYTLSDGSYQMITFIGVSCDATTEYWNAEERRCDCKEDEYSRNDEGICVPIVVEESDEIEEETEEGTDEDLTEGTVFDCSPEYIEPLVNVTEDLIADSKLLETDIISYINQFNKEINNQASNPCNNSTIAYCYSNALRISAELVENESYITDMVAEIIVLSIQCPGSGILVSNYMSGANSLDSYQEPINEMTSRLLENGCDEEEVADNGEKAVPPEEDPGFVQDGGTFTTGSSGIPGGGTGTAYEIYAQCMSTKGIDVDVTEFANIIADLNTDLGITSAAYYDDENDDPYKCSNFKQALNNYLEFYEAVRECIIEAGPTMTNYHQSINAAQMSINYFNSLKSQLPC